MEEHGYAKELWDDPRRKGVLKHARETKIKVKNGVDQENGFTWKEVSYEGRASLQLGVRMGWLTKDYDPRPNPDSDTPDEPPAPIDAPPEVRYIG